MKQGGDFLILATPYPDAGGAVVEDLMEPRLWFLPNRPSRERTGMRFGFMQERAGL